jgi:hypothetical protein
MDLSQISKKGFRKTWAWTIALSLMIVATAASLGRATTNVRGALTEKPDLAIFLLLPEEGITSITVLRETPTQRDYLAKTSHGPMLIILKKGEQKWFVATKEPLREER